MTDTRSKTIKATPYKVPDGYFDALQQQIIMKTTGSQMIETGLSGTGKATVLPALKRWRNIVSAAAAAVVIALLGISIFNHANAPQLTTDEAFARLTTDDQQFLKDMYGEEYMLEAYLN